MSTIDNASDYAHEATDKIAGAATEAAKKLGEKGEQLLNAEQKLMKKCCTYVSYHPIAALSIALAAGYLLGNLLSDR